MNTHNAAHRCPPRRHTTLGTPVYMSPQILAAKYGNQGFDGAAASLPSEDVERFMRELTVVAAGAQLMSSSSAADEALAGLLG